MVLNMNFYLVPHTEKKKETNACIPDTHTTSTIYSRSFIVSQSKYKTRCSVKKTCWKPDAQTTECPKKRAASSIEHQRSPLPSFFYRKNPALCVRSICSVCLSLYASPFANATSVFSFFCPSSPLFFDESSAVCKSKNYECCPLCEQSILR